MERGSNIFSKFFLILVFVLIYILTSSSVFADMSAPEIEAYEAVVINPQGASVYEYKKIDNEVKLVKIRFVYW